MRCSGGWRAISLQVNRLPPQPTMMNALRINTELQCRSEVFRGDGWGWLGGRRGLGSGRTKHEDRELGKELHIQVLIRSTSFEGLELFVQRLRLQSVIFV